METMNPRKVCATARYLDIPLEYVPIDSVPGGLKGPTYRAINPLGLAPTLQDGDETIWESAAIMVHLALKAKDPIWPHDPQLQVEVMRWISWDLCYFARLTGAFYSRTTSNRRSASARPIGRCWKHSSSPCTSRPRSSMRASPTALTSQARRSRSLTFASGS